MATGLMSQSKWSAEEIIADTRMPQEVREAIPVLKTVRSVQKTPGLTKIIVDPHAMSAMTQELWNAIVERVGENVWKLGYEYNPTDWRNPTILPLRRIANWRKCCHAFHRPL